MTTPVPSALADYKFVVVDVEGNGQTPPEIIELAALPVDETVTRADMRTWLIRPQKPIASMVTRKVHGIRNADVTDCPPWSEVAPEITKFIEGRVLVAHGAHVEYRVIGAHLPDWKPPMVLDTVRLAKYVWPGLPSYSLEKLVDHATLDVTAVADQQPHRAAYDTWCAWQLLRALVGHGDLDWPDLIKVATLPGSITPIEPQGGLW
jgi:DNA polymerase III epsilon subunit-like protein